MKYKTLYIIGYVGLILLIVGLLSYRPDIFEQKYENAKELVKQREDSIVVLLNGIEKKKNIIVLLTKERDSSLNEIERLESTLQIKQRYYEKVISSIDTLTDIELQRYFTINYPDTISGK